MNKIYWLIFILPLAILGCKTNVFEENIITQKIDTLDMNIYSNEGKKIYSITSPYSSFNNNIQKFESENTTFSIFEDEETKYIIYSDTSTLSDNNNLLELMGNVELQTLNQDGDILYADNFKWNIGETNYYLNGNVRFENKKIILNSGKAKLGSDNIIEFFNPVKYIIKDKNNENKYEIKSENGYYNIDKGIVNFRSIKKRVRSKIYF